MLIERDTSETSATVGTSQARKPKFSAIIADLESWLRQMATIIDEHVELSADLNNDLREMIICLNACSFRGCLTMAGIVLERILKHFLTKHSIPFSRNSMVGQLLGEIEKAGQYVDPTIKNIWNIINIQRIISVHAKDAVVIPSRDQAIMVVYAVKNTVTKLLTPSMSS